MILSWFDASEAKAFGLTLAKIVMEKMPVDGSTAKAAVKEKKKEVLLNRMALEIARFRETGKLNIYKKAKLGNSFKWALRDAGYDTAYVDTMTEWLMFRV